MVAIPILARESFEFLKQYGRDPALVNKKRILSVSMSSHSSSESNDSEATIGVPDELFSHQTLLVCEFSEVMADRTWQVRQNLSESAGDRADFVKTTRGSIMHHPHNAMKESDDWYSVLRALGAMRHLSLE